MADVSQLVPNISLAAGAGVPASGGGMAGALGQLAPLMDLQAKANANQAFQQSQAGRQRAGQIIAAAPDLATGLANAEKDPQVMAYAPDTVNTLRQAQGFNIQNQGQQASQNRDAITAYFKGAVAPSMTDPSQLDKLSASVLQTLPKEMQARVAPAFQSARDALLDGLDKMAPADAAKTFQARAAGQAMGAGLPADFVSTLLPKTVIQSQGGYNQPMKQLPLGQGQVPIAGPGGAPIQVTNTPQTATVEDGQGQKQLVMVPGGMPGSGGGGGVPSNGVPSGGGVPAGMGGPPPAGGPSNGPLGLPPPAPSTPGAVPIGPVGQSPSARTTAEAQAKGGADMEDEMNDAAKGLPNAIQRVQTLAQALQTSQAGGGAEMRTKLASLMQGLQGMGISGITSDMVNQVANGSLAGSQVFNSTILSQAISQLAQDNKGNGKAFRPEIDAALQAKGLSNDPHALLQLLNNTLQTYQVSNDQANKYTDFANDPQAQAKYGKNGFYRWYNANHLDQSSLAPIKGIAGAEAPKTVAGEFVWGPDGKLMLKGGGAAPQGAIPTTTTPVVKGMGY